MTTGPAGGLTKPYKGIIPASADTRPETNLFVIVFKGTVLS